RDLDEVLVTLIALGEYQKVVIFVAFRCGTVVILLTDVKLAADDGTNARGLRSVVEVPGAKDVPVVRHSDGSHAQLFYSSDKIHRLAGAVEKRVMGMKME